MQHSSTNLPFLLSPRHIQKAKRAHMCSHFPLAVLVSGPTLQLTETRLLHTTAALQPGQQPGLDRWA